MAASAFGNSGFIPLTLIVAIAANAPWLANDPGSADRGIAYVSVYLLTLSPCLWAFAHPYLSGEPFSWKLVKKMFSPPVIAILAGAAIGLVPPWKALFHGPDAYLSVLTKAADIIGQATIPGALLVLGGNLGKGPVGSDLRFRDVMGVSLIRFCIMPLIGIALVKFLDDHTLIPQDPVYRLVLMLQACTPGAINLVLMCQIHGKGEKTMSSLLFWVYLLSVPIMTAWICYFLYLVFQVHP